MFKKLMKLISKSLNKKQMEHEGSTSHLKNITLSKDIDNNITRITNSMNNPFDIKQRIFNIGGTSVKAAVLYIDSLVNEGMVLDHVLKPLIIETAQDDTPLRRIDFQEIRDSMMSIGNLQEVSAFDEIVLGLMSGDSLLIIQGYNKGFLIAAREYEGKEFSTPTMEPSVKGPQEAFVETLKRNIGLIRKRLRDPNLTFEKFTIGRRSKSDVVMVYIKDIADKDIVDEVRKRLESIDVDGISGSIQVGSLISNKKDSIFPLFQVTERPDRLGFFLMDGRVAIIVNGSPEATVVPVTLPMLLQSVDDYYECWLISSVLRVSRYIAMFISTLLPALYIAVTSFNPGMLPTNLVLSITNTRVGVPFPAILEALLMEFVLEILQEASVRLPKVVGQTISIVGGLVIGQSAVQAGIVSPIMVIIISSSAVASFAIPDYSLSLTTRILRLPFMILATIFGNFGIVMGVLFLITYLASVKTFGVRYLSSLTPYHLGDFKDAVVRMPLKNMTMRPTFLNTKDKRRRNKSKLGTRRPTDES